MQGLVCADENGNITLDVTNRLVKYIGTGFIDLNVTEGEIVNSEITEKEICGMCLLPEPETVRISRIFIGKICLRNFRCLQKKKGKSSGNIREPNDAAEPSCMGCIE